MRSRKSGLLLLMFIPLSIGLLFFRKEDNSDKTTDITEEPFVTDESIYKWVLSRESAYQYAQYGYVQKGEYLFLMGYEPETNSVISLEIYKNLKLINRFCTFASSPLCETNENYIGYCEPKEMPEGEVLVIKDDQRIEFNDYNGDGLLDFILLYDVRSALGTYDLLCYQLPDGSGFEEKKNGISIDYNEQTQSFVSRIKAESLGYTDLYFDSDSVILRLRKEWRRSDDTIFLCVQNYERQRRRIVRNIVLSEKETYDSERFCDMLDEMETELNNHYCKLH